MAGAFTSRITAVYETVIGDQYSLSGKTVAYYPIGAKLLGADRQNIQTLALSAGLSAQQIQMAPLGVSAPGMLMLLLSDQPVDIRTNAPSDVVFLSGVTFFVIGGHLSNIYVTTGSAETTLHLEAAGGSNAQLLASLPLS